VINNEHSSSSSFSIIPPLPLNSSMYPFGSSSTSPLNKPLTSFPIQSSNRINEEYLAQMHHIAQSTDDLNERTTHRRQSMPIHRFDSNSPTVSTYAFNNILNVFFFLMFFCFF